MSSEDCFHKGSEEGSLASRGVLCKIPPPPGTISCLAGFPGEMADSGRNPGFDGEANLGVLTGHPRTIRGRSRYPPLFFKVRAENGRFRNPKCSPRKIMALSLRKAPGRRA